MNRRLFLGQSAAILGSGVLSSKLAFAHTRHNKAHVVVVGAGYGGATAARYIRILSSHGIRVTLIEPNKDFISCPLSNLVVGGSTQIGTLTTPYSGLASEHGVTLLHD